MIAVHPEGPTPLQTKSSSPSSTPRGTWDEGSLLAVLAERCDAQGLAAARVMIDWMKTRADRVAFNTSVSWGSIAPVFVRPEAECRPFVIWTDGSFSVQFRIYEG
jgi:hypothetical protein